MVGFQDITLTADAMDTLSNIRIEALTRLQIELSGGWKYPPRRWEGFATADAPFSAVTFVSLGNVLYWCKAEKNWGKSYLSYSNGYRSEIGLTFSSADVPNTVHIRHYIEQGGPPLFSVPQLPGYLPEIMEKRIVFSGESFTFVTVESESTLNHNTNFVAKQDIKSLRKGLWRVRSQILESIPAPWKSMLGYGRQGKIILADN